MQIQSHTYRLFENFCFLAGSAYFVSGSYPDGAMVIDDDFHSTSIDSEIEDGFYIQGGRVATKGDHNDPDSTNAFDMLAGHGFGVRRGVTVVNPLNQRFDEEADDGGL